MSDSEVFGIRTARETRDGDSKVPAVVLATKLFRTFSRNDWAAPTTSVSLKLAASANLNVTSAEASRTPEEALFK